jgi:peptidoglycan/xylan/chitin deacetylase (PgdA/CDA1 family)
MQRPTTLLETPPASTPTAVPKSGRTTLVVLMFHRVWPTGDATPPDELGTLFEDIAQRRHCVMPGEPLRSDRLNVCLTFDDAYYDFYHTVLPLLRRYGLRALLAVPSGLIPETMHAPAAERLVAAGDASNPEYVTPALCTWQELQEVADSGHVAIAAHGRTHRRLDAADCDLDREIIADGALLAQRLRVPVESFVFPYGQYSPEALACVRANYRHAFRIGKASNTGWDETVLYRTGVAGVGDPEQFFSSEALRRWRWRRWWNRLRGR